MFARSFSLSRSAAFVLAMTPGVMGPQRVARASSVSTRGVVLHYLWTEADYRALIDAAKQIGANSVYDLAEPLYGESNMEPSAYFHTPTDPQAIGLNQITSVAAKAMGLSTDEWMSLLSMTPVEQLPYVVRSLRTAVGDRKLSTATEIYVANFAPGYIGCANNPDCVLYSREKSPAAYEGNKGLDTDKKGTITVGDIDKYLSRIRASAGFKAHAEALAKVLAGTYVPSVTSKPTSATGGITVWSAASLAVLVGGLYAWTR